MPNRFRLLFAGLAALFLAAILIGTHLTRPLSKAELVIQPASTTRAPAAGSGVTPRPSAPPEEPVAGSSDAGAGAEKDARELTSAFAFSQRWDSRQPEALEAFRLWTETFVKTPEGQARAALIPQGIRVAKERREAFRKLIQTAPEEALALAVPARLRQQLPEVILQNLEARLSGNGSLNHVLGTPLPGQTKVPDLHLATIEGRTYNAYVYGRRAETAGSLAQTSLSGVAIDRELAVSEFSLRALEPGEKTGAAAANTVCAVSDKSVKEATFATAPAVEVAGVVQFLCSASHVPVLEAQLEAAEGGGQRAQALKTGPASGAVTIPEWATGTKKVLVLRLEFPNGAGAQITRQQGIDLLETKAKPYFEAASYGKTTLVSTVSEKVYTLPKTPQEYHDNSGIGAVFDDALELAKADYNADDYDRIIVNYKATNPSVGDAAGYAYVQGKNVWIIGNWSEGVVIHELGHTYGLHHASWWKANAGTSPTGNEGTHLEYGDQSDVMGNGDASSTFNQHSKRMLSWLPSANCTTVTKSGTYRVYQLDGLSVAKDQPQELCIPLIGSYWLSIGHRYLRLPYLDAAAAARFQNGAYVLLANESPNKHTRLLSAGLVNENFGNTFLPAGVTFTEPRSGITLKPVASGGASPAHYIDVEITVPEAREPYWVQWGSSPDLALMSASSPASGRIVAASFAHVFNLSDQGELSVEGDNALAPVLPEALRHDVLDVAVPLSYTPTFYGVVKTDGTVTIAGLNPPAGVSQVPESLAHVRSLALSTTHAVALKEDGTVVCWGAPNNYGACNVPFGLDHVVQVGAVSNGSLALKDDGTLVRWGYVFPSASPGDPTNVVKFALGSNIIVALLKTGDITVLGSNSDLLLPPSDVHDFRDVACGWNHILGLRQGGQIVGWGANDQFGTVIPSISGFVGVAAAPVNASFAIVGNGAPRFTLPPFPAKTEIGGEASFRAFVVGESSITLTWQRLPAGTSTWIPLSDNETFGGTHTEVLAIKTPDRSMNGDQFRCSAVTAGHPAVLSRSAPLVVDVPSPKYLKSIPSRTQIKVGSPLTLSVDVTGYGSLSYQWRHNGKIINGATSPQLSLTTTGLDDEGEYDVLITDSGTTFTSSAGLVELEPAKPPGTLRLRESFAPRFYTDGYVRSAARQADGKIIIAGSFHNVSGHDAAYIARLTPEGEFDSTFKGPTVNSNVEAVVVAADGKILIGGYFTKTPAFQRQYLARLLSDGTLDETFGKDADPDSVLECITVGTDNTVYVGGYFSKLGQTPAPRIAKLTATGAADPSWTPGYGFNDSVLFATTDTQGKVYLCGAFTQYQGVACPGFARINPDGSLDDTFTTASTHTGSILCALPLPDGNVILGGNFKNYKGATNQSIVKLDTKGQIVPAFTSGLPGYPTVYSLAFSPRDGAVVAGGILGMMPLVKMDANGALDSNFGTVIMYPRTIVPLGDGGFFAGGSAINGSPEPGTVAAIMSPQGENITPENLRVLSNAVPQALARTSDGKWLVGGYFRKVGNVIRNNLVRLLPDGTPDPTFDPNPNSTVTAVLPVPGNRIMIAGWFANVGATPATRCARLFSNGALDASFSVGTGPAGYATVLATGPENTLYVAGAFTAFNGTPEGQLVRLLPNGSLDPSFHVGSTINNSVRCLLQGDDRSVTIGGEFTQHGGLARRGISRVTSTGALDETFVPGAGVNGYVLALAPAGNALVAGGNFSVYASHPVANLVRLSGTGAWDSNLGGGASLQINRLLPESSGGLIAAGGFYTLGGASKSFLGRFTPDGTIDTSMGIQANSGINSMTSFTNILRTPEGWYLAAALAPNSLTGSYLALFESADAPRVETETQAVELVSGDTVTLRSTATGSGTLHYQWKWEGTSIPGATSSSLTLTNATTAQSGNYTVLVWNEAGYSESRVIPVSIAKAGIAALTQDIVAGQSTTLELRYGPAAPSSYQWFKDGVAIPGATSSTLKLPAAQLYQSGDYTVYVTWGSTSLFTKPRALKVLPAPPSNAHLVNLSTRAQDLDGDKQLIPGFVIAGTGSKRLLIRGVGPTLGLFNLSNVLKDPVMRIVKDGVDIVSNDDWASNAGLSEIKETMARVGAFALPEDSKDSVLLVDLPPGAYTAPTPGKNGTSGVALVELYDADSGPSTANLTNISNRGYVGNDADVMIPGIVISQEGPRTLLVRGVGISLAQFGISGFLEDPILEIYHNQDLLLTNDDYWRLGSPDIDAVSAKVGAFSLLRYSTDAGLVVTLPPGAYTVKVSGKNGGTGVALVEVYLVP